MLCFSDSSRMKHNCNAIHGWCAFGKKTSWNYFNCWRREFLLRNIWIDTNILKRFYLLDRKKMEKIPQRWKTGITLRNYNLSNFCLRAFITFIFAARNRNMRFFYISGRISLFPTCSNEWREKTRFLPVDTLSQPGESEIICLKVFGIEMFYDENVRQQRFRRICLVRQA